MADDTKPTAPSDAPSGGATDLSADALKARIIRGRLKEAEARQTEGGTWLGGLGKGLLHGAGNILYGAAQLGARTPQPGEELATAVDPNAPAALEQMHTQQAADIDKQTKLREAQYRIDPVIQAHPWAAKIGEIGGEIAATSPLMLIPGGGATLPARLATGAAVGAAAGSLEPVTTDDFWSAKAKQAGLGAAGGILGEAGVSAVGRVIAPKVSPAVRRLADAGVQMTPGQLGMGGGRLGANVRRAEEALKSFPILGTFVRGAESRSIEDFNRSVINQTLEPLGVSLPAGTKAGHEAIGFAQRAVGDAYDRLLPGLTFKVDRQFLQDIQRLQTLAAGMPPTQRQQFAELLQSRLVGRLGAQGNMDGLTLKQVESELGNFAGNYSRSPDAAQRQLGTAVKQMQEEIRNTLMRQNPQAATQLKNINSSYAMLSRIENAVTRRGASEEGVFRPTDLLAAVKAQEPGRNKRRFARGDALLQTYAKAAQKVLPGKMPDSGTAERGAILFGLVEAVGALMHSPETNLLAAAPIGLTPLYTQPAQRAIQGYMVGGAGRQAVGQTIGDLGPYVDPALGIIASGQAASQ